MADGYNSTASSADDDARPSDNEALFIKLKGWYKQDIEHVAKWRKEAKEDTAFRHNDQWSEEDKRILADQKRPPITFDRIAPMVNAVVGSEINNRREVQFYPREQGDALKDELYTAAGEWFRDKTNAEDEESNAFEDTVVTGMGWTDTRLDFECDPDGAPKIERLDNMKMVWSCKARKPNLEDTDRLFMVHDDLSYDEAEELTGESDRDKLHAGWVYGDSEKDGEPHNNDPDKRYTRDARDPDYKDKCCVVEARWFEKQPYYRGADILNQGKVREYTPEEYKIVMLRMPEFQAVKQHRKVLKRVFLGSEVLGKPDQPLVPSGLFGWECITGYHDRNKNQFYGVVRAAKDPQRWSNKFFSQVMYLLNSQSKGGVIAERGVFEDDRQAEASWAKSDAITYVKAGGLQAGKIEPKPVAQFPAGFFTLFQEAKEGVSQATGLSPEFVGTREVDQAGVLENTRKQSTLNLLAALFNSLRRYRKRQGQVLLYLIQNHLSDGRLIRIVGDDKAQYVPLTKGDNQGTATYDVIVDDSPTSPNEKDKTWNIIMQMMPFIQDKIPPDMALQILDYSPLPASLVAKLKDQAKKAEEQAAANPPPPSPEEIKSQAMIQKSELDAKGKELDLQAKQAGNEMDAKKQGIDLIMKMKQAELDAEIADQKANAQMRTLAIKEAQNAVSRTNAAANRTSAAK